MNSYQTFLSGTLLYAKSILVTILIGTGISYVFGQSFNKQSHWQGRELFKEKGCIQCIVDLK